MWRTVVNYFSPTASINNQFSYSFTPVLCAKLEASENILLLVNEFALTPLTETPKKCILNSPIPRLCNGSTSDSGSDCGGSNPPWGTKAEHFFCSAFFVSFSDFSEYFLVPSNIGLVRDPLKVERRVRFPLGPFFFYYGRYSTNFKIKNHYFSTFLFCKKRNCFDNFNFVGNYFGFFCKTKFGIYQLY